MNAGSRATAREPPALVNLARQHSLVAFFVLTYAFSWSELGLFGALALLPAAMVIGLTTLAPTVAALVMTVMLDGREGVIRLVASIGTWRVGLRWYAAAMLLVPLVLALGTSILPEAVASYRPLSVIYWIISYGVMLTVGGIAGGPLFEEPGWRGFALPRLQRNLGPLRGTLVLGVLWGAWHLPQYLIPDWAAQNGGLHLESVVTFLATVVAIAVILTWIFNNTGGSLLLAMLAHASIKRIPTRDQRAFPCDVRHRAGRARGIWRPGTLADYGDARPAGLSRSVRGVVVDAGDLELNVVQIATRELPDGRAARRQLQASERCIGDDGRLPCFYPARGRTISLRPEIYQASGVIDE